MGKSGWMGLGNILKLGDADIFLNGGARQRGCYSFYQSSNHDDYVGSIETSRFQLPGPHEELNDDGAPDGRRWTQTIFCHHARAVDFYLETRQANSACQRVAYQCELYKDFLDGKCFGCGDKNEKCRLFEYNPNTRLDVPPVENYSYFMQTNSGSPFCANHYRISIQIDESNFKSGTFELTVNGELGSATFDLKGDWDGQYFTSLITTDKFIGNLKSATGRFKSSWFDRHGNKQIEFMSMSLNYMSNINAKIRQKLSGDFVAYPGDKGWYAFSVAYDDQFFED